MRRLLALITFVLAALTVPAIGHAAGAAHNTLYSAQASVQMPTDTGPLTVGFGVFRDARVESGETVVSTEVALLQLFQSDPEAGVVVSADCPFEPTQMSIQPLRDASLSGQGVCVDAVSGREFTFAVDLTWRRQAGEPVRYGPRATSRAASVAGSIEINGTLIPLDDAVGLMEAIAQTDPLANGLFVGGGGMTGNIDDTGNCFQGGVQGSSYDVVLRWARSENGVFHAHGSIEVTLEAVTFEEVPYTLVGGARIAVSFLPPPPNEWGERVLHMRVPISFQSSDGRTVEAIYFIDMHATESPASLTPLGLGVNCA